MAFKFHNIASNIKTINRNEKKLLQQSGDALFWRAMSNINLNSTQFPLLSKSQQILKWTLKHGTLKFHVVHQLIILLLYDGIHVAISQF